MRTIAYRLLTIFLAIGFASSVLLAQAPTIASINPISGSVGSSVTISGTNFNATPANNIVRFGAVQAAVTTASSTSLTVNVPPGATYDPISVTTGNLTAYSLTPFSSTFISTQAIDASSFAPKVDFSARDPYNVAMADIDGDGKPDLIVTNQFDTTISVYRNTSATGSITASSFDPGLTFKVMNIPIGIATGDLDGDGNIDLAISDYNNGSVSVLRNTSASGTISFDPHVEFPTYPGSGPFNVAIADFNGDGKPDLAVANDVGGNISVFGNTSTPGSITSGSFATRVNFTTGADPFIAIADIDGDGKVDLVSANWGSNSISVLRNLNTGGVITSGSFTTRVDFATAANPFSLAVGDLDGDGKPDVVTPNENSGSVSVLRNLSSSGSISFDTRVDYATGAGARFSPIGDIDGDGKPDIAVCNRVDDNLSVLKNSSSSGTLSFNAHVDFAAGLRPRDVVISDLNGDGKPDLLVANEGTPHGTNVIAVLRNTVVVPPIVSLTPPLLNFGNQRANTTSGAQTVTLKNIGGQPLTITGISASGDFGQTNTCPTFPATLDPDSSCSIAVTFTPSITGARTGAITIEDNATGNPHSVPLSGTGVVSVFSGSANTLPFFDVFVDFTRTDSITVTNNGQASLNITSAISTNDKFSATPTGGVIAPSSSQKFFITFHPTSLGPQSGYVIFTHDGQTSPDSVTVHGTSAVSIDLFKLKDADGNLQSTADQIRQAWKLSLYRDSVSGGTLVASSDSGHLVVTVSQSGAYVACEADSGGSWIRLNGNHTRYDTITIGSSAVIDTFVNFRPNSITVRKLRDSDGQLSTSLDRTLRTWHLELRKDSLHGSIVASANTDTLSLINLADGIYYAIESDSSGWTHLGYVFNGSPTASSANAVSILVSNGKGATIDFVNFHANSLTVRKFVDNDGKLSTTSDRVSKSWHLEIRKDAITGPIMVANDAPSISSNSLPDGQYYAIEADSAGWIHLGYSLNTLQTSTASSTVGVALADGETSTIDLINAPPIYSSLFRSFKPDSIALSTDEKGKIGKLVKRKPNKISFTIGVRCDSANITDLHVEFNAAVDTNFPFYTVPPSVRSTTLPKLKLWNFIFDSQISANDSVHVYGFAKTTNDLKVTKYYWTRNNTQVGGTKRDGAVASVRRLPMPNRINALFEAFAEGGFGSSGGMLVGNNRSLGTDSSKFYGWLLAPTYSDVLKTLRDKTGLHTGAPVGFDRYTSNHKPILKQQRNMPPAKNNNRLVADMIALKLNISASALGITPPGFGELIFDDNSGNPWNESMIKDIGHFTDSLMMGYIDAGLHTFTDSIAFGQLDSAIQKINCAFEGTLDTISFADQLKLKGTNRLADVPYLRANPNVIPDRIIPTATGLSDLPTTYSLYQNYPNPFNPTTTITFDLPNPSSVSLTVYNLLGQVVARILDHVMLEDGPQEVEFNADHLASGVYLYRIVVDGAVDDESETPGPSFLKVKKMVLVK